MYCSALYRKSLSREAGLGAGARPEDSTELVVECVAIRHPPEEILLEGEREIAERAHGNAGARADDALPADGVDLAQE